MKNVVFWDLQEAHGVTSQKAPFFRNTLLSGDRFPVTILRAVLMS
jgi:hypothetical protein